MWSPLHVPERLALTAAILCVMLALRVVPPSRTTVSVHVANTLPGTEVAVNQILRTKNRPVETASMVMTCSRAFWKALENCINTPLTYHVVRGIVSCWWLYTTTPRCHIACMRMVSSRPKDMISCICIKPVHSIRQKPCEALGFVTAYDRHLAKRSALCACWRAEMLKSLHVCAGLSRTPRTAWPHSPCRADGM